ncbi:Prion protein 2A PrP2A [Scophthalmus maximus]|uniref:Prion protein 2A PrP2A n=1 Tax=Scophthalmus maximus TaxID=52904 RepID=A0A2U9BW38_SCOMX|nr:Prion protein 2A PrP2A [Scophthalmus maximus]
MKLTVMTALCLLLLLNISFSLAKKSIGLGKRINLFKKTPKIKTNLGTKPKTKQQFNQGGYPQQPGNQPVRPGGYPNQGGYPQQPGNQPVRPGGYPNQGGYPQQPGNQPFRPGGYPNQGGYPQQPGNQPFRPWSYPNQGGYPAGGYPAGGYPVGGYPYGGNGGHGGYPGGYYNYNPHNNIMSPRYGGSYGYGGYGGGGGSPFSHSVQAMGVFPQDKSRGFGRGAVMAAAGGAMAGMALGYGLGRFPRPPFHFHSPQEEYYYNHYMYRKYGVKSTDTNDYGRDYRYVQPTLTYDRYMDSCMKRTDLLPVAMGLYPQDKSRGFGRGAVMSVAGGAMAGMALGYGLGRFPRPHFHFNRPEEEYYYNYYMYRKYGVRSTDTNDYGRDYRYDQPTLTYDRFMDSCMKRTDLLPEVNQKPRNKPAAAAATTTAVVIETNSTAAENSSTSSTQPEAGPVPPASQAVSDAEDEGVDAEDDDDTVSIVEIGYPALIEQLKARRCLELYMVYSEKYLKRQTGGAQGPEMGLPGLLVVVTTGTLLTLLNSNVLTLQRLGLH